jgi:hypothetical protein
MCRFKFRLLVALMTFGIGVLGASSWYSNNCQYTVKDSEYFKLFEPEIIGFNEVVTAKNETYVTAQGFIDEKFLCLDVTKTQQTICTTTLIGSSLEHKNMHFRLWICNEQIKSNCIEYNTIYPDNYNVKVYDYNSNLIDLSHQIKITGSVSVEEGKGHFRNPIGRIERIDNSQNTIIPLSKIDLSLIGHISPKGRVQDLDYNQLPVVEQLIAHDKESIPYLISKLNDETKAKGQVMDFWNDVRVRDVAFFILTDFFTDKSWENPTIEGASFNTFLGCNNKEVPSDHCYYNYIEKHGKTHIKTRWQKIWNDNKDKIFWDEAERCFRIRK